MQNHAIMATSQIITFWTRTRFPGRPARPASNFGGVILANSKEQRRRRSRAGRIVSLVLKIIGTVALVGVLTCAILACFATVYVKNVILPDAHLDVGDYSTDLASTMYYIDKDTGAEVELLSLHGVENRIWVSYDEIPDALIQAAVSIEDKEFWTHHGVNWRRTIKGVSSMFTGQKSEGGPTIPQQLIKNVTQ